MSRYFSNLRSISFSRAIHSNISNKSF
jgi:hypothetical protein